MSKKWIYIEVNPYDDNVVECCLNGNIVLVKRGEKCLVSGLIVRLLKSCGIDFMEVKK